MRRAPPLKHSLVTTAPDPPDVSRPVTQTVLCRYQMPGPGASGSSLAALPTWSVDGLSECSMSGVAYDPLHDTLWITLFSSAPVVSPFAYSPWRVTVRIWHCAIWLQKLFPPGNAILPPTACAQSTETIRW